MGTNMKLQYPAHPAQALTWNYQYSTQSVWALVLSSLGGRQYSVTVYTSILSLHLFNYFLELQLVHIDFRTNICHTVTGAGWLANRCCDRGKTSETSEPTALPRATFMNFYAPLSLRTLRLFCTS